MHFSLWAGSSVLWPQQRSGTHSPDHSGSVLAHDSLQGSKEQGSGGLMFTPVRTRYTPSPLG